MGSTKHIAVIGAGPAGLRAAEVLAKKFADDADTSVSVFDAKPSAGRKFLVAGKSGLNLTNGENWDTFLTRYQGNDLPREQWNTILNNFDNNALRGWSGELGIETYVASSSKVFPIGMKAAPLLRRWIERLRAMDVQFHFRHEFRTLTKDKIITFDHQGESVTKQFDNIIFALGGGSWSKTGSTGQWIHPFERLGISVTPLSSANCGWEIDWDQQVLDDAEGLPLKNLIVHAGSESREGELVITKYGLEGGPIYRLGPAIKSLPDPQIHIDFKPTFSIEQLVAKMESAKRNFLKEAKQRWKLSPAAVAILESKGPWNSAQALAEEVKHCCIPLTQPRPIEEAISSAGGIKWSEVDENLMLRQLPGVYCVGEMLDWEAPTGGYLLQACFATGNWVGEHLASQ